MLNIYTYLICNVLVTFLAGFVINLSVYSNSLVVHDLDILGKIIYIYPIY